ncbi:hypothetical protein [Actinophytocola sp.]|uniref:hypothetical protein n=1 Tax=Actinophytocola sp. TaxID=1872138 RepID=UPI00389A9E51
MRDGADQIRAWKEAEGTEGAERATGEHPAGDVRLPMSRGHVARAMVLAGMVIGLSAVAEAGTFQVGTTTGP